MIVGDAMDFVRQYDPEVGAMIRQEYDRQCRNIELIASENIVSEAVMAAMGSVLTNKYAEGYPASAIMVAANAWTKSSVWPLPVSASCLAQNMPMYSRTRVHRPIWRCIRRWSSRAIPFWV